MDAPAAEYHHGDQDPSMQVSTYRAFMGLTKWASLAISVGLVMLTLWFCTDAGFVAAFISGLVVLVLGVVFLRSPPDSAN
jgi:thiamine transporter ThiT